jgi:transcriptional regulator with XRE-family HTH domain
MIERLQKIMDHAGVTPNKFAAMLGIQRSAISHIMSGRNNPSLTLVQKILKCYPDISADWLLFGDGNMLKNNNINSTLPIDVPPSDAPTLNTPPINAPTTDEQSANVNTPPVNTQLAEAKPVASTLPDPPRTKVDRPISAPVNQPTTMPDASTRKQVENQTVAAPVNNTATNVQSQQTQIQTMLANGLIVLDHSSKTFTVYSPSM